MLVSTMIMALAASSLVAGHGKIAVATGDQGGNTTALGIQGGVIPGAGPNSKTEVDTTVFRSTKVATNGLGKTKAGPNTLDDMENVVAQSGSTLPQVSDGGSVSGTYHIVTSDGAGPLSAVVDSTGTGAFANGASAEVVTQVPGKNGNIRAARERRSMWVRALTSLGIEKRATNINEDYPFKVAIPAGTTCTGTMGGMSNVCLLKVANPSNAGPFGGVFAFQMAGAAGNSTAGTSTETASTSAKKVEKRFSA